MTDKTNKKRKIFLSKKKGFSLLELMVAIFIFTLIMISSSAFFSRAILAYKNVRSAQRDLEDAQFVLGLMAKTLRTSSIKYPISEIANPNPITVFDYSQNTCIRYSFDSINHKIQSGSATVTAENCNSSTTITSSNLSNFYVNNAYFSVTPSCYPNNPDASYTPTCTTTSGLKVLGKLTISFEICPDSNCSDKARIQTSVSLRDYGRAGL